MATLGQSTDMTDFKSLVLAGATEDPEAIVELAKRYSSKLMSYAGSLGVADPAEATQVALITALRAVDVAKPPSENRFEAEMFRAIRMGSPIEQGRHSGRTDASATNGSSDGVAKPPAIHDAGPIHVGTPASAPQPADIGPREPIAPPSIDPELLPPDFDPDFRSEPVPAMPVAPVPPPSDMVPVPVEPTAEGAGEGTDPHRAPAPPKPPGPQAEAAHGIELDPTITADPIPYDGFHFSPSQSPTIQSEPATATATNERVIANDVEVEDEDEFELAAPNGWSETTDLAPPRTPVAPLDSAETNEHPVTTIDPDLHDPRPPSLETIDQDPPDGRGVFDVPTAGQVALVAEAADTEFEFGPASDEALVPESDLLDTAQYDAIPEDAHGPADGDVPAGYHTDGPGPAPYEPIPAMEAFELGDQRIDQRFDGELATTLDPTVGNEFAFAEHAPYDPDPEPPLTDATIDATADGTGVMVDRRQPYVERRSPRGDTARSAPPRAGRRDRTDGRYDPVEDIGADPEATDNGRLKLLLLAAGPALLVIGLTVYLVTIQSDSLATRTPVPADGNPTATTAEPDAAGERATFGSQATAENDADDEPGEAEDGPVTTAAGGAAEPSVATSVTVTVVDDDPAPGGDFSGETLVNVDLADTDLADANFSGSSLTDVDLSGADLVGADFTDAVLTDVNFERAEISGADFTGATQIRSPINGRWDPNDPPTLP